VTYAEALRWIVRHGRIFTFTCDDVDCSSATEKAREALKKQVPMKPVLYDELFLGKKVKMPHCPTCEDSWNSNEFGNGMQYCWSCGQAIDWSDMK